MRDVPEGHYLPVCQQKQKQVETFKCLGSMNSENGGCDEEVTHGVGVGWESGETCRE